ncbi:MAG: FliH/SctL family protein [Bryobacteraceae bacterium]
MSSKVLKATEPVVAAPVLWRLVSGLQQEPARDLPPSQGASKTGSPPAGTAAAEAQIREAYEKGLREGEAAARAAVQPVLDRLAHSVDAIAGLRGRARREAEGDLLRLAIAIARRILHRELSVDPDAVSGLIKVAIEKLQTQEIHRVRVHPDLEAAVRRAIEGLAAGRSVQVVADRGRLAGDVVFETERGNLDASVETQLQEIGRGLADRLRGGA